mmetsp:Transcript_17229/g.25534  ORF Transcript_17229/g.25534 Transcript_17229/m.25534 type:complete len:88 (-) Transcript_17229:97-360(-)
MFSIRTASSTLRRVPRTCAFIKRNASGPSKEQIKETIKVWTSDPGAYPVMGIIAVAISLCSFWGFKTLTTNPDVQMDKSERKSVLKK